MTKWAFVFGAILLIGSGATRAPNRSPGTLVFYSQRDPGGGLYAESAGGGRLRVLRTRLRDDGSHWSPDGKHLLFLRDGDPVWVGNLWIAEANGRHAHVLARDAVQP